MMHPATRHIQRLQAENRLLLECVHAERKLRRDEAARFRRRLESKVAWLFDVFLLLYDARIAATKIAARMSGNPKSKIQNGKHIDRVDR